MIKYLIRFTLKIIISNICYYHAKAIKQDQLHLKNLYEVSVRIKSTINMWTEALNHYSHFKEKEENKKWAILLENIFFRPSVVTCYAPCTRNGWVFIYEPAICTTYTPDSTLNKHIQILQTILFLVSKKFISDDRTTFWAQKSHLR